MAKILIVNDEPENLDALQLACDANPDWLDFHSKE